MAEITPQSRRLRQKCDTVFSVSGPDGSEILTKCGTDFLDSTRDLGGGVVFKRGLVKCTKQGLHIVCPKCRYTKKVDDVVIEEVIKVLQNYKEKN